MSPARYEMGFFYIPEDGILQINVCTVATVTGKVHSSLAIAKKTA
jgi:hypothetical protein